MQYLTLPIIHARGSMVCIYLEGRNTKTLDFPAVTLVLKDATAEMFYQDLSCNTAGHLHHERFFAATFGAYMKPLSNSRRRQCFQHGSRPCTCFWTIMYASHPEHPRILPPETFPAQLDPRLQHGRLHEMQIAKAKLLNDDRGHEGLQP